MEHKQVTDFGTYARFYTMDEAGALLLLLESNNIPYIINQDKNQLDSIIIGDAMDPMIIVSIPSDQFTEVNQLVTDSIEGITPKEEIINNRQESPEEVKQEHLDTHWLILGYLFSLFAVIGIIIGFTLINSTKRLHNGERIKMYDASTIRHGRIMLLIGIITTIWWIWKKFIVFI